MSSASISTAGPAKRLARHSSKAAAIRARLTGARAPLQESRSRSNGFITLFTGWSQTAANLSIAALVGTIFGALTVSGFNFLSEVLTPAFGAHQLPWTMGFAATCIGVYFGYGQRNIKKLRDSEAMQKILRIDNDTQGAIMQAFSERTEVLDDLKKTKKVTPEEAAKLLEHMINDVEIQLKSSSTAGKGGNSASVFLAPRKAGNPLEIVSAAGNVIEQSRAT